VKDSRRPNGSSATHAPRASHPVRAGRAPRWQRALRSACWSVSLLGALPASTFGQQPAPQPGQPAQPGQPTANAGGSDLLGSAQLAGRPIESVRVTGNKQVPTSVILANARTREGTPYDPQTAQEDIQRIYGLRRFSNVTGRIEPTPAGVIVTFNVVEQRRIAEVRFRGNASVDDADLRGAIDLKAGESVDPFRIGLARRAIESVYRTKNFPYASVDIDQAAIDDNGVVTFLITEGPSVKVRNITFPGAKSFSDGKLKDQIQSRTYIPIFRNGQLNLEQVEDDVASVRRFYEQNGFFDIKVGRRVVVSPDQKEVQIDFVIEEGPRYVVDSVEFSGNTSIAADQLKKDLKLVEGISFDGDLLRRDVRQLVKSYSPLGFIYVEQGSGDAEYLRITPRTVFQLEPGKVKIVYEISEGKPFHVGQILVRGNTRSQDKLALREMRVAPGDLYNSATIQEAEGRIRGQYFSSAKITPVGDDPDTRDVLVEVTEAQTAFFTLGAGVNSNGGVGGNVTYVQRNFDLLDFPDSFEDLYSNNAFVGGGQTLRISLEPGTQSSNASIRFTEPWLFDQPYRLDADAYFRTRRRDVYDDERYGGRLALTRRFGDQWAVTGSVKVERVDIGNIKDKPIRSFEILDEEGYHTLDSLGLSFRRDTTDRGFVPSRGSVISAGVEAYGLLGGDETFQRWTVAGDWYHTLYEDLLDRRTILALHGDVAYISGDAPFYERLYGGGLGSIRGFRFRGVTPRSGPDDDRVGGNFSATGSAEVSFPLFAESLRGVVFTDVGTVESDFEIGTIRSSVGAGIRLNLPILGQVPVAIDFAFPLTKDGNDETQIISFSLGITP
jgi:outer membrane protein assembly factor BamA